ncbi:iron complex outermembrane recepter protein [Gammaproteobacteria bacterium]
MALAITGLVVGTPAGEAADLDPTQLSLEDLMQAEVTSVAKRSQHLADVAAAAFIITSEDIRRTGVLSLPEVLQMAPGLEVARLSGDRWSVSIRGFGDRYVNKLLVLVDGRNVYSPAFSGVFWESLLVPLEDIERIEVIRGPGAAVWGTNAVNGVINIITKSAAATQGGLVSAGIGSREGGFGTVRQGGGLADGSLFYRLTATGQQSEPQQSYTDQPTHDRYRNATLGLRVDGYPAGGGRWNLSGDAFQARSDTDILLWGTDRTQSTEQQTGASLRAHYETPLANGSDIQFQAALAANETRLPYFASEHRTTLDLDFQHHLTPGLHDITWGLGYRWSGDSERDGLSLTIPDHHQQTEVKSFFAQDELRLRQDLRLTLGGRFDHYSTVDMGFQPTARLLYQPTPNQSLWASASRALKAPARLDLGYRYFYKIIPPGIQVLTQGNPDLSPERLVAYEAGYRTQWASNWFLDLTLFSHRYKDLGVYGDPVLVGFFPPAVMSTFENLGMLRLQGLELSLDGHLTPTWRLQASMTRQRVAESEAVERTAELVPRQHLSLRSLWNPWPDWDVDVWLRAHDRISAPQYPEFRQSPSLTLDLRLAWQPTRGLELALVGQNLLEDTHYQGEPNIYSMLPSHTSRAVVGQLRWEY